MKKSKFIDTFNEWLGICKVHWKEIFALSFVFHFVFDVFIFWLGVFVGRMW